MSNKSDLKVTTTVSRKFTSAFDAVARGRGICGEKGSIYNNVLLRTSICKLEPSFFDSEYFWNSDCELIRVCVIRCTLNHICLCALPSPLLLQVLHLLLVCLCLWLLTFQSQMPLPPTVPASNTTMKLFLALIASKL